MPNWEYKVITSGLHGFASPALLEAHLNALGKEEWEIVNFQTQPNNPLAFNGLARRSTQRDWAPPEIPALVHAQKVHVESHEPARPSPAKLAPAQEPAAVAEPASEEKAPVREETLRPFRDTERDLDPDAPEEDWDKWEEEQDELPTFFEAIKPHMRRNQKGPGMAVALDYLAKRWELRENDVVNALLECGFVLPENEESEPVYVEFEGDLFWVNRNNRGNLFLNTREKPRPVFRTVPATKLSPDDPAYAALAEERAAEKAENERRNQERIEREAQARAAAEARAEREAAARAEREAARAARDAARAAAQAQAPAAEGTPASEGEAPVVAQDGPLKAVPSGEELLDKIRPFMRRNRRGPGYSGSTSFLARALHVPEPDLIAAFAALGLVPPTNPGDKPASVEMDKGVFWVNKDNRGGIWINGRERRPGSGPAPAAAGPQGGSESSETPAASESVTVGEVAPAVSQVAPVSTSSPAEAPAGPVATEVPSNEAVAPVPSEDGPAAVSDAGETVDSSESTAPFAGEATPSGDPVLAAIRLLLRANKRGSGFSGELGFLARTLGKSDEELTQALVAAGLAVPQQAEDKPVFVEQAGEIFWFNRNPTDGSVWVNAKASKSGRKPAKPRTRKPKAESETEGDTSANSP